VCGVVDTQPKFATMDWKYKHFHQQRLFAGLRAEVFEAARVVMTDSLGWTVSETPDGFTAQGFSFGHAGIANFHFRSQGDGTAVDVELLVERAGLTGFMLFDVGGYYNTQIRKWLDAIQVSVRQNVAGQPAPTTAPILQPPNKGAARVFHGCLLLIAVGIGLYFLITLIEAIIGLTTGNLVLMGRSGNITVHGPVARVISALILGFGVWIIWRIKKKPRPRSVMP